MSLEVGMEKRIWTPLRCFMNGAGAPCQQSSQSLCRLYEVLQSTIKSLSLVRKYLNDRKIFTVHNTVHCTPSEYFLGGWIDYNKVQSVSKQILVYNPWYKKWQNVTNMELNRWGQSLSYRISRGSVITNKENVHN